MSKENIIGKIISIQHKEVDHSEVVPITQMSLEETIEEIKLRFQYEEDKTMMNKIIAELLNQKEDE